MPQQPESSPTNPLLFFLIIGAVLWFMSNRDNGPTPAPVPPEPVAIDPLQQAYDADRLTQIAVLKELAQQPFDGTTAEGRRQAGEWFTAQRFRNRPSDYGAYTDAVAEAIATNAEAELAGKLEVSK